MKEMNCCLTLVCHKSLEERLVDVLLSHPAWVRGFSVKRIEGGSQKEKLPSMLEQVRGRSQRAQIDSVMNLDDARLLIAHLKLNEPNHEIAYWLVPVLEFGRLA
ncbi:MAG: DUF3240 domain-containing protein [Gallionella sp.]|nr:DUF3240 domain-containing protein [Gallionella sp.]OIO11003.1 MAG: hypothetical protein AUJ80_02770 [Gallionellaceae bacterium CG1_02_60_325]PIR09498.1 MAG: hypothetical protein COV51_03880 [Gallionellaceae bacterium CG11_big_fil_rev_8_21_14_0_20_60_62]PIV47520.1 MAG: DUF3240 domain-containing protein [Gallionellaceae bacterium CG02_land_8_20_14_3_00_60_115]PJC05366.1 MAG: DUF3240 domain-containing protein [Gallionellaceae bacterium CG_4_9_14_0_8_um_filter_60_335]